MHAVVDIELYADSFVDTTLSGFSFLSTTRERVYDLASRPFVEELNYYLTWQTKLSKTANKRMGAEPVLGC